MLRNGCLASIRSLSALPATESGRVGRASKSLEMYMRKAREHEKMMSHERSEMERGKRHLANMMAAQPHELSQERIDEAIAYLFPSGLADKKALPVMRPPDEILPRFNKLSFDQEGRPAGSRFYTLKPTFYSLLSEVGTRTEKVIRFAAEHRRMTEELTTFSTGGTIWLNEDKMTKKFNEKISTVMYSQLITALNHLISLPSSSTQSEFLLTLREPVAAGSGQKLFGPPLPEVIVDDSTNRRSATAKVDVKRTEAEVRVVEGGKEYTVDGQPLHSFQSLQARELLISPLIVAGVLGGVGVEARTRGVGGESAVPRAVRHALSLSLASLYPHKYEALRLSGYLTRDPRKRERSKVNQPGARAKWIWKRR